VGRKIRGLWIVVGLGLGLLLSPGCGPSAPEALGPIPRPADMSALDSTVAALVQQMLLDVEKDTSNPEPRTRLAMVYQANELFVESAATFVQSLTLDAEQPVAWYHLARLQHREGDLEAAIESMGRSIALQPDYVPSYWRRGGWHFELGDVDRAATDFDRALELNPGNVQARLGRVRVTLEKGQAEEALVAAREILRKDPTHSLANLLAGNAYRQLGDMTRAEYHLKRGGGSQVIRDDLWSNDVLRYRVGYGAQVQLAIQLANDGQNDVALQMLQSLRERNPDDVRVLAQMGQVLMRLGKNEKALVVLQDALDRHPENPRVHLELSAYYYVTRDAAGALRHAERSIELRPEQSLAHIRKGTALRALARNEDAVDALEEALRLDPGNPRVLETLGDCLATLKRWEPAAERYQEALQQQDQDADLHVRYGLVMLFAGNPAVAETALVRALELGPSQPDRVNQLLQQSRRQQQEGGGAG